MLILVITIGAGNVDVFGDCGCNANPVINLW